MCVSLCVSRCGAEWWLTEAQNNWDILAEPEILHEMWAEAHSSNNKHLTHTRACAQNTHTKTAILGQNLWKQCSVFFRPKLNGECDKQAAENKNIGTSLAQALDT